MDTHVEVSNEKLADSRQFLELECRERDSAADSLACLSLSLNVSFLADSLRFCRHDIPAYPSSGASFPARP